ncbi:Stk1 family PASTA domain-containing Ser/Thr kinase [Actinocorallia longicatena]|uniref:non-specific serine/threonine protein kinase n=1 Tax=Actinocorallia longicatena TaxID=111803 RepID=A0ABP6QAX7_9ACTN
MDATQVDPLVGQVLDGRYRVESRVARGGMATVYVGRDLKLDRIIALKVMHQHLAQDEEFVRRFIGEAKAAAALSHPNVVAVYDQRVDGAYVYLTMEYLPGRTLRDLLNERGRLPVEVAVNIMKPVLAALGAAHRAGVVHRDVKPENVLLTTDGQVKVADFGLARAETDNKQTKTGVIIGTVAYMAPEQVIAGRSDVRSDVYAAGVLLFELLTGRQPHEGDSPLTVAYKHVNDTVPLPSSLVPGIPPRLDAVVTAATSRDADSRPGDANHFYALLTDPSLAVPAPAPQQERPHNATAVLHNPAPGGRESHTGILPPVHYDTGPSGGDQVLLLDRIMHFVTGRFVLVTLGVIASMVIGWATWYQVSGQYDHVPKIIGVPKGEAINTLNDQGISFKLGKADYSDGQGVEKGDVAAVDPGVGTKVKPGEAITLVISLGRRPKEIPNVANSSVEEAKDRLGKAGFTKFDVTYAPSDSIPKDKVIKTDPKAGKDASPDETIKIVVSNGVAMPNVVGRLKDDANGWLGTFNLRLNIQFTEGEDRGKRANEVLSQTPPPGTPLKQGDTVTLVINKENCFLGQFNPPWCSNNANNPDDDDSVDDQGNKRIPRVVGRPVAEAQQRLQQRGFNVVIQHSDGGAGSGTVQRSDPAEGNRVPQGTTITLWD